MNFETLFKAREERTVKAGLVGAGEFGSSFIFQGLRMPGLDVPAVVTRTVQRAVGAYEAAGVPRDEIAVCESPAAAARAFDHGKRVVAAEPEVIAGLALDVLVEGSGHPEAGARYAELAIEQGWHVVMVSKEVDSVVGPYLTAKAKDRGLVYSPADGDQPSLLIGLITWARVLGLRVLAAGKSSEYDFVYDPATRIVSSNNRSTAAIGLDKLWRMDGMSPSELAQARSELLSELPQKAAPDLCEMGLVANATGFKPDKADFHSPISRPGEVPSFLSPRTMGGLLSRPEASLDIVNCLRRPFEASLAGGVFVIVECLDKASWQVLADKGHPVNEGLGCAMVCQPSHLLGVETATSVLAAVLLGRSTGGEEVFPVCDLTGRTERDFKAGEVLVMGGHHHTIDGIRAELVDSSPLEPQNPAPFYLMANRPLSRDVPAGCVITNEMVEVPEDSTLLGLRRAQDRRFASGSD